MIFMTILWVVSFFIKNVSIVDIFWGTGFIILASIYYLNTDGYMARNISVIILVFLWGSRLTLHLFLRNRGKGEDFRYEAFRKKKGEKKFIWFSFFQVFLLQGMLMTLVSMPLLGSMITFQKKYISFLDILAFLCWITGFIFECVGDYQLMKFKKLNDTDALLREGLWKYTRHPNYFGDFMVWTGFGLFSIASGSYFPVLGTLIMTILLLKISGVTMMDKSLKKKKKGFTDYERNTNSFFPWFPKKSR